MAAPEGNKYAIGNSGKPKLFNSPEELELYINEYFIQCDADHLEEQQWVGKDGDEVQKKTQRPYTIEGLCLHLDIDRRTLLNYEKKEGYEEYFHVISRAKRRITDQYITFGLAGTYNVALIKFLLSNNTEYKDRTTKELEGGITVGVGKISKEEAKEISDLLENEC